LHFNYFRIKIVVASRKGKTRQVTITRRLI
jgi:hypothetical protein